MAAAELDILMVSALAQSAAGSAEPRRLAGAIQKVGYSHEGMIDLIIAHPGISQGHLAAHFGYSESWISQVISSDAFQAAMAKRRAEVVDPILSATIEEQFKGIVARSLAILREKLDRPSYQVPDNLVLRTMELSSRAAGYGARDTTPAVATSEVHIHLENLGSRLEQLLARKQAEVVPPLIGEIVNDA